MTYTRKFDIERRVEELNKDAKPHVEIDELMSTASKPTVDRFVLYYRYTKNGTDRITKHFYDVRKDGEVTLDQTIDEVYDGDSVYDY